MLLPLSPSSERLLPRLQQLASLSELPHDCTPLLLSLTVSATGCECSTHWACSAPLCSSPVISPATGKAGLPAVGLLLDVASGCCSKGASELCCDV